MNLNQKLDALGGLPSCDVTILPSHSVNLQKLCNDYLEYVLLDIINDSRDIIGWDKKKWFDFVNTATNTEENIFIEGYHICRWIREKNIDISSLNFMDGILAIKYISNFNISIMEQIDWKSVNIEYVFRKYAYIYANENIDTIIQELIEKFK